MRTKLHQALVRTATPLLHNGEQPQLGARGRIGRVTATQRIAVAAVSAIASGGASVMTVVPKDYFVLLTNQRLLVLQAHWLTFRPVPKIVVDIPRHGLLPWNYKRGFTTSFAVAAAGQSDGISLSFPRTERTDAEALASALGLVAA